MSFSKAQRFNELSSTCSSQGKYVPLSKTKTKEHLPHSEIETSDAFDDNSIPRTNLAFCRQLSNVSTCSSVGRDSSSRPDSPQPTKQRQQQRNCPQTQAEKKMTSSPTVPSSSPPSKTTNSSSNLNSKQNKSMLETQFLAKKRSLGLMTKQLIEKQKQVFKLHSSIKEIREKVLHESGKDLGLPEEIKLIDIEHLQIPHQALEKTAKEQHAGGEGAQITKTSINKIMWDIQEKINSIPKKYLQLSIHIMARRQALMDWLLNIKEKYAIEIDDAKVQENLEHHIKEGENLKIQYEEVIAAGKIVIDELLKDINAALIKTQENADEKQENINQLKKKLESVVNENQKLNKTLQFAMKQIECKSSEAQALRKSKSAIEEKLKCIHSKLKDMDTKADSSEMSVTDLEEKNKSLEMKLRTTEKHNDFKLKEANKKLNFSNMRILKFEAERKALDERINKHKMEIDAKNSVIQKLRRQQIKSKQKGGEVDDETARIKDLKNQISELQLQTQEEISGKEAVIEELQNKLDDSHRKVEKESSMRMKAERECKSQKELLNKFHHKWEKLEDVMDVFFDTTVCKHSTLEKSLWRKLRSTRKHLLLAQNQNEKLKGDHQKCMEMLKQATENENVKSAIQNMHQELNNKDETIRKLRQEAFNFKAVSKRSKDQLLILKHQLSEHQKIITSLSDRGAISEEMKLLSAQVDDLRTTLTQALCHNEELRQALVTKQIEVKQSTKVLQEQQKVQQDFCNIIKGKEKWPEAEIRVLKALIEGGEKSINEVMKKEQLAKLDEMMHSKEKEVMKLESLVKQLKEQQERCQLQRIQYETRIEQLIEILYKNSPSKIN